MARPKTDVIERARTSSKPVVLCLDDDLAVLSALRRLLRPEPYEVVTAVSAAQALAALRSRSVEVVISDERMPETSGTEFLADVRQRWPWIRRIILTAYPGRELANRGVETGIDSLLLKPWDDENLKQTIRQLIREAQKGRSEYPGADAGEPHPDSGGG